MREQSFLLFFPDDQILVSMDEKSIVKLWYVAIEQEIRRFEDILSVGLEPGSKGMFVFQH